MEKIKVFTEWFGSIVNQYEAYKSKNYRCKIINVEMDTVNNSVILQILIR
jgi:hypothetical protein